ncbi:MAG TPA: DEAD/DEAH box helicase, partial [Candidatus Methanomethylophilaceae archaeon]|nr:DEAD/DEAH box helicase [Candidatus Methanomethylophilaceae archaeon]
MRFDELDIPKNVADALKERGFVNLHPPQEKALPIALEGHSLVVAVPTASGKSIIGYIPALKKVLKEKKRVLYIVPLKALASEKRDDLVLFSHLGYNVAMSTGDLDSGDGRIKDADIVVATSEKADSMIRHGSRWMDSVGLVIADEIHLIHDPGRGPTLEIILTKLMKRNPELQIIA